VSSFGVLHVTPGLTVRQGWPSAAVVGVSRGVHPAVARRGHGSGEASSRQMIAPLTYDATAAGLVAGLRAALGEARSALAEAPAGERLSRDRSP
jgi:hypothetical protein